MYYWELRKWGPARDTEQRTIRAANYSEALWRFGTAGFPPTVIWTVTRLRRE